MAFYGLPCEYPAAHVDRRRSEARCLGVSRARVTQLLHAQEAIRWFGLLLGREFLLSEHLPGDSEAILFVA